MDGGRQDERELVVMKSSQPGRAIGIFDSGVGGLTVARLIFSHLPEQEIIYFGDTAHVPYGSRSPRELIKFGDQIVSFLIGLGARVVIAACNTSSSVSLPFLREKYDLPILGMVEPGAKAALEATKNKRVGVIATEATVRSGAYPRALRLFDAGVEVFMQACPRFVPLVEAGKLDTPEAREAAAEYLEPLRRAGIDTLVLGCTHYPFLAPVIAEILGPGVKLVDPAEETVKELIALLGGEGSSRSSRNPRHRFYASGSPRSFYTAGRQFLGGFPFTVEQVNLNEERREIITGKSSPGSE